MTEQDSKPNPYEFIFKQLPDEFIAGSFRMAVLAENWDSRDKCFDELDRRRLGAMEEPALEEELQFRRRFEDVEGTTWRDYCIRTFTIALIGSDEEKRAILDAIADPLQPKADTYTGAKMLGRIVTGWEKILQINPPTPPQT